MKEENKDDKEGDKEDSEKERSAARSSVFFSSEKEAMEPRPLPLL